MEIEIERHVIFRAGAKDYVAFVEENAFQLDRIKNGLLTVVHIDRESSVVSLKSHLEDAMKRDDVLCEAFLDRLILIGLTDLADIDMQHMPETVDISLYNTIPGLLPGPYLADGGALHRAYRVHEDDIHALSIPLHQSSQQKVVPLRLGGSAHSTVVVAVPSRLRYDHHKLLPLSGVRVVVKDIFDIEGIRTSVGSRDYLRLYPPAHTTAPAIQALIDLGCDLIGLSKMGSMVLKQEPTQAVEFLAPFNPRADGWQSPSGGSSGQASAIAQYDWLDIAVASDSTFSGRIPAQVAGTFSLRPSTGALSTDGMWSGVPQWDTPCFFARDIALLNTFAEAWYAKDLPPVVDTAEPYVLVYFEDFLPTENLSQMVIFRDLMRCMESTLRVIAKPICLAKEWSSCPPFWAGGMELAEFLSPETSTRTYVYSFWERLKPYWQEYQKTFAKKPYLPLPKHLDTWKEAWGVTSAQHEDGLHRIQLYKDWIQETVLSGNRNTVIVSPLGEARPCYRDEWPSAVGGHQELWSPLLLSPILGAPELIIPAGEIPFVSRVTGEVAYLPVCVTVTGWPGSDLELVKMMQSVLQTSARHTKVVTGPRLFANHKDELGREA